MWRQLWRRIELPGLGLSPSQPAEGSFSEGGRSVKHVAKGREEMTAILQRHFGQFIVPFGEKQGANTTSSDYGQISIRVMIFLPPQHHLLLKATMQLDSTLIQIRTDFWRVLPYVDPLLDLLCAS
jgi:hypothetical protein